jgi:hypothetical protein
LLDDRQPADDKLVDFQPFDAGPADGQAPDGQSPNSYCSNRQGPGCRGGYRQRSDNPAPLHGPFRPWLGVCGHQVGKKRFYIGAKRRHNGDANGGNETDEQRILNQ